MTGGRRRPLEVWVAAGLFVAVGVIGLAVHSRELTQRDGVWVIATEALALVAGVFLFLGHNWARWLALAWMAFHVGLSFFHDRSELIAHGVIFAGIALLLFRADARRFFAGERGGETGGEAG